MFIDSKSAQIFRKDYMNPEEIVLAVGDYLAIDCQSRGIPMWFFDGEVIPPSLFKQVQFLFVVPKVNLHHAGEYWCYGRSPLDPIKEIGRSIIRVGGELCKCDAEVVKALIGSTLSSL